MFILQFHLFAQLLEVRFLKLTTEFYAPRGFYLYLHSFNSLPAKVLQSSEITKSRAFRHDFLYINFSLIQVELISD